MNGTNDGGATPAGALLGGTITVGSVLVQGPPEGPNVYGPPVVMRATYSLALLGAQTVEDAINATKSAASDFVNSANPAQTLESQALAQFVGDAVAPLVELEVYFGDAFTDRVTGLIVPGPESFASIGSRAYSLLPNSIVIRDVKIEP